MDKYGKKGVKNPWSRSGLFFLNLIRVIFTCRNKSKNIISAALATSSMGRETALLQ